MDEIVRGTPFICFGLSSWLYVTWMKRAALRKEVVLKNIVKNEPISIVSYVYPWEPVAASTSIQTQQQRQQAEFVSTMTFSNSGRLRPPSCPCCQ